MGSLKPQQATVRLDPLQEPHALSHVHLCQEDGEKTFATLKTRPENTDQMGNGMEVGSRNGVHHAFLAAVI